eukprot:TRINITY_DN9293_c0_g2_i1.p1 TRINITY_DN9293_c0_g2~~TRINITY_DN9293_c0_g2_i1.p1  ORF type:complete len:120 (+),score=23.01 TRINITY_DN9293_c0_g2_i1:40-399(+)
MTQNTTNDLDKVQIKAELLHAVKQTSHRGLYYASQWAAELLCSLKEISRTDCKKVNLPKSLIKDKEDEQEQDLLILAKTYFDLKEYYRTAHILRDCKGLRAKFLRGRRKEKRRRDLRGF